MTPRCLPSATQMENYGFDIDGDAHGDGDEVLKWSTARSTRTTPHW